MMQYWQRDMDEGVLQYVFTTVNRVFSDGVQQHNNMVNLWQIQFPVYVTPHSNDTFSGARYSTEFRFLLIYGGHTLSTKH